MDIVQATLQTQHELAQVARTVQGFSQLTLPEIDAVVEVVSRLIPAGNVPAVILSSLARLPGRRVPENVMRRDINLIFRGLESTLDRVVFVTLFAGPAMVIWGYQNLLRLAGKDPIDSFPEGTWQFYVDYALREDSARHANETHGFDSILQSHGITLNQIDRMSAWVLAAIHLLRVYPELLANEWRERVYTFEFNAIKTGLYQEWEKQRPYGRGMDAAPQEEYARYRHRKFDEFMGQYLKRISTELKERWWAGVSQAELDDLPAYQRQMSIQSYLEPGVYNETRVPLDHRDLHVGVISDGSYYLIPLTISDNLDTPDPQTIRSWIGAILQNLDSDAQSLIPLARVKRGALTDLKLNRDLSHGLRRLRSAPILLNFEKRDAGLPLAEIREGERGIGDHALTVFDTGRTFVFDQSHIYFDGAWGAAFAEIMTNEALAWAVYLNSLPAVRAASQTPENLTFSFTKTDLKRIKAAPQVGIEASAETTLVNLKSILALRRLFKKRSDLLRLTVNDILLLYRAVHGITYQPRPELLKELALLKQPAAAAAARKAMEDRTNPAILIPVDASLRLPRERVYPLCFEAPLDELDLLALHTCTIEALGRVENRTGSEHDFEDLQRVYLATLAGFGALLGKAKDIASAGKSTSTGTIRLLAYLPSPIQRLLDQIPGRFEVLNDLIKGREVFSNVGAVASSSTLTRFISAKDDNDKKILVWGVLTDADGVMRLTLRDFRPHVRLLHDIGRADLGGQIAQDYLDSYATGLNGFVFDLRRITAGLKK